MNDTSNTLAGELPRITVRTRVVHGATKGFLAIFAASERILLPAFNLLIAKKERLSRSLSLIATVTILLLAVVTVKLLSLGAVGNDETPLVSDFYHQITSGMSASTLYSVGGLTYEAPKLKLTRYKVMPSDNLWLISKRTGLRMDTIISINKLNSAVGIHAGMTLLIPNRNGIMYTARAKDTLASIAEKYSADTREIMKANEMKNSDVSKGDMLFIPGGRLSNLERAERLGILFSCPLPPYYKFTSGFGMRRDPFTRVMAFHKGIDLAYYEGAPVYAAKEGQVIFVGDKPGYGNVVIIQHPGGYTSYYGHLRGFATSYGAVVGPGRLIGYVGNTGYSTGPHLHFEIRKDGRAIDPMSVTSLR